MNNRRRYLQAAVTAAVIGMLVCSSVNADVPGGYYQYPEKLSSMSTQLYLEKCRIPETALKKMTDEQLAQAVADFPFLINVTLSASHADGVKYLAEESDAYRTLLLRKNAKGALSDKVNELRSQNGGSGCMMKAELLEFIIQNEAVFL